MKRGPRLRLGSGRGRGLGLSYSRNRWLKAQQGKGCSWSRLPGNAGGCWGHQSVNAVAFVACACAQFEFDGFCATGGGLAKGEANSNRNNSNRNSNHNDSNNNNRKSNMQQLNRVPHGWRSVVAGVGRLSIKQSGCCNIKCKAGMTATQNAERCKLQAAGCCALRALLQLPFVASTAGNVVASAAPTSLQFALCPLRAPSPTAPSPPLPSSSSL